MVVDSNVVELRRFLRELNDRAELQLQYDNYAHYPHADADIRESRDSKARAIFAPWCEMPTAAHDLVILFLPKGKELRELLIGRCAAVIQSNGRLLLVGPLRGGIKSARKVLQQYFENVVCVDTARHCAIYLADTPRYGQPRNHRDWLISYQVSTGSVDLTVRSYPGVFSHGRLNEGSQLLLQTLRDDPVSATRVLDVGCGCGLLGTWMYVANPKTQISMVDTSARALLAASETAEANGLTSKSVRPSDVLSDANGTYDLILSNPPFHQGLNVDHSVLVALLRTAPMVLAPGSVIRIVVNRFIACQSLMSKHLGNCRLVAENSKYEVCESTAHKDRYNT